MNLSKETKELLAANGFNVDPRFTYPLRRMEEVRQGWVRQEYRYGAKLEYPEPPQEDYHKQGMQSERAVTPPSSAVATLRAAAEEEREVEERAQRRRADMTREVLQAALAALKESWPAVHNQMERVTKELSTVQGVRSRELNRVGMLSPQANAVRSRTSYRVQLNQNLNDAASKLSKVIQQRMEQTSTSLLSRLNRMDELLTQHLNQQRNALASTGKQVRLGGGTHTEKATPESPRGNGNRAASPRAHLIRAANEAAGGGPMPRTNSNTSAGFSAGAATYMSPRSYALTVGVEGAMPAGQDVSQRIDWRSMPREVLEAKVARIERSQEEQVERYHRAVQRAQVGLLREQGLLAGRLGSQPSRLANSFLDSGDDEGGDSDDAEGAGQGSGSATPQQLELALNDLEERIALDKDDQYISVSNNPGVLKMQKAKDWRQMVKQATVQLRDRAGQAPGVTLLPAPSLAVARSAYSMPPLREGGPEGAEASTSAEGGPGGPEGGAVSSEELLIYIRNRWRTTKLDLSAEELRSLRPSPNYRKALAADLKRVPMLPAVAAPPGTPHGLLTQARLDRLWGILKMPRAKRTALLEKYIVQPLKFDAALDAWERGAAAVMHRERLLAELLEVEAVLEEGGDAAILAQVEPELEHTCAAFVAATKHAVAAERDLWDTHGDVLSLEGQPYPGQSPVGEAQMLSLIAHVKALVYVEQRSQLQGEASGRSASGRGGGGARQQ